MMMNKGLLNIKNKDDKCFMWCHIAYLFPALSHKCRLKKYINHENDVDYTVITFPITLSQIEKIENLNKINFNIFTLDDDENMLYHYISLIITMIKYVICY